MEDGQFREAESEATPFCVICSRYHWPGYPPKNHAHLRKPECELWPLCARPHRCVGPWSLGDRSSEVAKQLHGNRVEVKETGKKAEEGQKGEGAKDKGTGREGEEAVAHQLVRIEGEKGKEGTKGGRKGGARRARRARARGEAPSRQAGAPTPSSRVSTPCKDSKHTLAFTTIHATA